MNTVKDIQEEINRLYGKIALIEEQKRCANVDLFITEIRNLLTGVGEGYVEGDDYAGTRYYSNIPGVKNIRISYWNGDPCVNVKVLSPIGFLLPDKIVIDGTLYKVTYNKSEKYSDLLDY